MHPIERLRWIARARDEAPATLAAEAAWTLSELAADEPHAVVTACRRLLQSHVTAGPIWWVAATVLVAPDIEEAARRAVGELCGDPTADLLAGELGLRFARDATLVVACPADTVREALGKRPSTDVRVFGSSPGLRSEVRAFGGLVEQASGWELEEANDALDGAALVLVEALAAGPRGLLVRPGVAALGDAARGAGIPLWGVAGVGRLLHCQLFDEMLRRAGDDVELIDPTAVEAMVGPSGLEDPVEGLVGATCPAAPELLVRAG
jgi:hypothetical protein